MNKRILKFKAWSSKEEKMYGVFDLDKEDSIMSQTGLPLHIAPQSYFVWLQFTGLKDKNGKEIYEGDIVKGWIPGVEEDVEYNFMEVKFEEGCWSLWFRCDYLGELYPCVKNNSIEVIGNIYENPKLLK